MGARGSSRIEERSASSISPYLISVIRKQYEKKFGRFGDAVVESNMQVMEQGFQQVTEIQYGEIEAEDRSSMRLPPLMPTGESYEILPTAGCAQPNLSSPSAPAEQAASAFLQRVARARGSDVTE